MRDMMEGQDADCEEKKILYDEYKQSPLAEHVRRTDDDAGS